MNKRIFNIVIASLMMLSISCDKDEVFSPDTYQCDSSLQDSILNHPNSSTYQQILDTNGKDVLVGAVLLVKDRHGLWIGSTGKADIASDIDMQFCSRFMIASISKVFTSTIAYRFVDNGLLSLDDPISKWLDDSILKKLANAKEATIGHLLSHTSGIPDYYSMQYQMDMLNKEYNNFRQEDILEYAYGAKATHPLGESYYYSNSNFLLLGMIFEKIAGKSLQNIYTSEIFEPLNLSSAYFGTDNPIPYGTVKGYADVYGNGAMMESEFLYKDELSTADGGIAINAHDLSVFIEKLWKGESISSESLSKMTDWFDLPEGWENPINGHTQNGYGLEHFITPYGNAIGHTGSIFGFSTIVQYFYEQDATYILLVNCASYEEDQKARIYQQTIEKMFQQ